MMVDGDDFSCREVRFKCVKGDKFTFARFYREAWRAFMKNFNDAHLDK